MLNIKNLNAYYGESIILKDVNLSVPDKQIVCLIGRNGVGKTTLLKSIMGLVSTPTGSIQLGDNEIINKPTYYRAQMGIGYVPQGRDIFPQMTVQENLELGLEMNKISNTIDPMIYDLFPVLKKMSSRRGGDLSGGQQQQLAIARALAGKPKILILDEPTEGIQPSIIQEIGHVIKILKDMGYTIFIVEQYLEFVLDIADYFYVMEKGEIVDKGYTSDMDVNDIKRKLSV
ncbi:urea ABC transporter ATP-binding subunit UrtE [uncultured Megamonas sp.]|uniref:urea ABC transporter ATP-binding subunit UrtE n=1 Tax=uncultured Megamonas sp. TaxID=286140 RepID=UPI00259B96C1|nr:urea ABC transporter ATP-binding subunit UrtE [uncultured Megamonas sp.]